ncbi:hypothetical protein VNO77_09176 [Canavalia gladiata]|uniref:AB hydrolase-1 domain-containing protein n=1 Tax=Canavalia gladiata TaxID=3824 RepID=A0AAN9M9Q3_CANGL
MLKEEGQNCEDCKHFVLVHGALHGAWCWYKVATILKSAGHNVTTLDMAACGINSNKTEEIDSISEYHQPLMTFMDSLPPNQKVILVGHSLGGLNVSIAMEKFPEKISVAVFITATVVSENLTYSAFTEERRRRLGSIFYQQRFTLFGPNKAQILSSLGIEFVASRFYQLSPIQDLTLALSLLRPLPPFARDIKLLSEQTEVTKKNNGRVSKVFIIAEKDNLKTKDFQMWIIERTGPYAEVKVVEDSDHMVMFSKSEELSSELLKIAKKY